MKLSITGFPNSGKTTVFNVLTGMDMETTTYPTLISAGAKPHIGIVKVPDKRIDKLSSIFDPRKTTYATVEYIDYAGITAATAGGNVSQDTSVFNLIKDVDAIVHVVRAFEDESVIHPMEKIDSLRDVKTFETELILGDLEFVEKRIERMELAAKKGKKQVESEKQLLLKCKEALENEIPLRNVLFTDEEKRFMLSFQCLTTIPEIIVLNIGEKDINTEETRKLQSEVENYFKGNQDTTPLGIDPDASGRPVIVLCGKIEMEIAQLPEGEAKAFLDDLGIDEPAMYRLCRVSYESLGLISFFTVGDDEVKAWTIKRNTAALKAAGKVHSDIERGFIRAETVSFDDYISSGEEMVKARKRGLVRLEGKTYIVKDGDIINFKFNV